MLLYDDRISLLMGDTAIFTSCHYNMRYERK